jgi:hypothetical protein
MKNDASDRGESFREKIEETLIGGPLRAKESRQRNTDARIFGEDTTLEHDTQLEQNPNDETNERRDDNMKTATNKATTKITKSDDEFRVRLFIGGEYQAGADYFTDDREDAKGTAAAMIETAGISDKTTDFAKDEQADFDAETNSDSTPAPTPTLLVVTLHDRDAGKDRRALAIVSSDYMKPNEYGDTEVDRVMSQAFGDDRFEFGVTIDDSTTGLTKRIVELAKRGERLLAEDGRIADRTYLAINRAAGEASAKGNDDLAEFLFDITANG